MNNAPGQGIASSTRAASPARYRLRMAAGPEDVRAAQVLRFLVFNVELREGLEASYETMLDSDRFDPVCDHLLVETTDTHEVVGTYRLQTGTAAGRNLGYYSAQEFDFGPFEPLRGTMVELGRACVRSDHRNFAVLNLLWKGIAQYAAERGARWLIGCSSLTSQDTAVGAAAYRLLSPHLTEPHLRTSPTGPFVCPLDVESAEPPAMPRLLMGYLALGARICGPPAIDREFKTIDFLTLLDLGSIPPRVASRFLA
jgi:putative hemolysin